MREWPGEDATRHMILPSLVKTLNLHSNLPQRFSNQTKAKDSISGFNENMYCTDFLTGETLFQFSMAGRARSVILETFANRGRIRLQMKQHCGKWIARIKLAPGWCLYSFEVDGRPRWNRDAGKMKTQNGRPCSLAVISTKLISTKL
jgi:hypothetical protein